MLFLILKNIYLISGNHLVTPPNCLTTPQGSWALFARDCRVDQSGACSSSDMITSGGRKSKTTMEDKLIVVVCGYSELYDTTLYFY